MSDTGLRCKSSEHNGKEINLLCLNQMCDKIRPACSDCLRYFHNEHLHDLIDFSKFEQEKKNSRKIIEPIRNLVNDMKLVTGQLKKLFKQQIFCAKKVQNAATTQTFHNQAKQLIFSKSLTQYIGQELMNARYSIYQLIKKLQSINTIQQLIQQKSETNPPPSLNLLEDYQDLLKQNEAQSTTIQFLEQQTKFQQQEIEQMRYEIKMKSSKLAPNSVDSPIEKLPIYFICTKTPKCKEWKEIFLLKHQRCGTTAYFHPDGNISCDDDCPTYTIDKALFSCKNNFVFSDEDKNELERIDKMGLLADLVEDSLAQDNHSETQKMEFREQVPICYLQFPLY